MKSEKKTANGRRRKKARRGNGEGSITLRKDGRWQVQISVPTKDGSGLTRATAYANTEDKAEELRLAMLLRARQGSVGKDAERVMFVQLASAWLTAREPDVRASTLAGYEQLIERHIFPSLGAIEISKITRESVETVHHAVHAKGLSASTRRHVLWLTRSILQRAVDVRLIDSNPAADVRTPRGGKRRIVDMPWTVDDARAFLEAAWSERLYAALYLLVVTGLRRGELLGLRWSDLDQERSLLTIQRSLCKRSGGGVEFRDPKTASGTRVLHLSTDALEVLKQHRASQDRERSSNELWRDEGLMFPSELGTPFHPDNLRRVVDRSCKRAGLIRLPVHSLRHLNASLMLRGGADEKVVSQRLGHSRPSITRSIYQHIVDEQHRDAATLLDGLVGRQESHARSLPN